MSNTEIIKDLQNRFDGLIPFARKKCMFRWPQNCSGFEDLEEGHIAAIWLTRDLQKMGDYDGRKNV